MRKFFKTKYVGHFFKKVGGIYELEFTTLLNVSENSPSINGSTYPIDFNKIGSKKGLIYNYYFEIGKGQLTFGGYESPLDLGVFDKLVSKGIMGNFLKEDKKEFKYKEFIYLACVIGAFIGGYLFKLFL